MKKLFLLVIIVLIASPVFAWEIEKKPFSVTPEWQIKDGYGRPQGTIREKPFALTPTYEYRDRYDRPIGELREKPFSLNPSWEFKETPGYRYR